MHISKFMRRSIAMLGMALVGSMTLAAEGTNYVVSNTYAEPFTNATLTVGYAITNLTGWSAGAEDTTYVTNENYTLPDGVAYPVSNYNHNVDNKVLCLSTGTGALTNTLGDATFTTTPLYVDTMVNFVLSDGLPTSVSNDVNVKAAVFANETSNLVVYCGGWDLDADPDTFAPSKFVVTPTKVTPGTWYRLTVTLDSFGSEEDGYGQAFEVRLNGTAVWSEDAYTNTWKTDMFTDAPDGGSWFLSAANKPGQSGADADRTVVSALAFQGTGYIDDLVVTKDEPVYSSQTWFEITQSLTGSGTAEPSDLSIPILLNGSTQIVYTAAQYWQIQSMTTNAVSVDGAAGQSSFQLNLNNVQDDIAVAVTFVRPWRTVSQTIGANGSGNRGASGTDIMVLNGDSTNVTYTADNYWKIAALTTNAQAVSGAAGNASYLLELNNVISDIAVDVSFVRPTRYITQTIGAGGTGNLGTDPIPVPNGANTSVTYTVDNTWYVAEATGGTYCTATNGNGTAAATLNFTEVLADTTAGAVFNQKPLGAVVPLVPTSYGLYWNVTAEWAAANQEAMQTGYMLNVAPTTSAGMEIGAINVQGSDLSVLVLLSTNNVPVDTTINGTLWVYSTTNLAVGFTGDYKAELQGTSFTNGGMKEVTFTDADPTKFYKAEVTLP